MGRKQNNGDWGKKRQWKQKKSRKTQKKETEYEPKQHRLKNEKIITSSKNQQDQKAGNVLASLFLWISTMLNILFAVRPFIVSMWRKRSASKNSICIPNCGCVICDPNPPSPPSERSITNRFPYLDLNGTIQHLWEAHDRERF